MEVETAVRRPHIAWPGKLAEPMPPKPFFGMYGALADPNAQAKADAEWDAELKERWALLLQLFGLDQSGPDFWYQLASALVRHAIPGFLIRQHAIARRRGRSRSRASPDVSRLQARAQLVAAVELLRQQHPGISEIAAVQRLYTRWHGRRAPHALLARWQVPTMRQELREDRKMQEEARARQAQTEALLQSLLATCGDTWKPWPFGPPEPLTASSLSHALLVEALSTGSACDEPDTK